MKASGFLQDSTGRRRLRFSNGDVCEGKFVADYDWLAAPASGIELFKIYEEIVNTQQFSCLPEIENKIDSFGFGVVWDGDGKFCPVDVQITTRSIIFPIFEK